MDLILTKGETNIKVKYGPTLFPLVMFIPMAGILLAVLLWFRRGLVKEILCQWFILFVVLLSCMFFSHPLYQIMPQMAAGLWFCSVVAFVFLYIYFIMTSVKNANIWRIKMLLSRGYTINNQEVLKDVNEYQKPKWMIFSSF